MAKILRCVQAITTADTTTHGIQPCHPGTAVAGRVMTTSAPSACARVDRWPIAKAGSNAGDHTLRKTSVTIRAVSDERTSVKA